MAINKTSSEELLLLLLLFRDCSVESSTGVVVEVGLLFVLFFVLRDHDKHEGFIGPRFLTYSAALEMHPLDADDRLGDLKDHHGIGYCNITKCCTTVCPEHIHITDNAIIPLKERVVDRFYDPVTRLLRLFR